MTEATPKQVIIVVNCGNRTIGLLVDAVSDIITVRAADIQATPELARDVHDQFVDGIAVFDERMVTILSMDQLTTSLAAAENTLAAA
jgi:purine-binding chemotaxis protein CheW